MKMSSAMCINRGTISKAFAGRPPNSASSLSFKSVRCRSSNSIAEHLRYIQDEVRRIFILVLELFNKLPEFRILLNH